MAKVSEPGFKWEVKPYRWLYQLREEYVQAMFIAGSKKGYEHAVNATNWMRQNAPWQDRTDEERFKAGVGYPPGARAGLRAKVVSGDGSEEHREALSEVLMKNAEQKAKVATANRRIQAQRATQEARLRELVEAGKIPEINYSVGLARIQEKYPFMSDPDPSQTIDQMNKEFRSNRIPLVSIKFSHHRRVTYGIWLEIAKGGKYSIIDKAVSHWGKIFMNDVSRLANLKQYRDRIVREPDKNAEERFDTVAAVEAAEKGRPYEPWERGMGRERQKRRKYYDYDEYLARKAEAVAKKASEDVQAENLAKQQRMFERDLKRKAGGTLKLR